jgi:hypothetical protein
VATIPPRKNRLAQRYVNLVLAAIVGDAVVGKTFFTGLHLIEPPTTLLRPRVITRVLRNAAKAMARA